MEGVALGLLPSEPHRCPLRSPPPLSSSSLRAVVYMASTCLLCPGQLWSQSFPDPLMALGPEQQEFDRLCGLSLCG